LFVLCFLLFTLYQVEHLDQIHVGVFEQSQETILVKDARNQLLEMYHLIADMQLNRDFVEGETEWKDMRQGMQEILAALDEHIDNPDETASFDQFKNLDGEIVQIFENEMLPALKQSDSLTPDILALNKKIDDDMHVMEAQIETMSSSAEEEIDEANKEYEVRKNLLFNVSIFVGLFFITASILLGITVSRSVTRPINKLVKVANAVSDGNINQDLEARYNDEVGVLFGAFGRMMDYLKEMAGAAQRIADGDLTVRMTPRSDTDVLGHTFVKMTVALNEIVNQISDNASQLDHASRQLAQAANQTGRATNQIATTMQQIAQGVAQQTEAINNTNESAEQMGKAIDGVATGSQAQESAISQAGDVSDQIVETIQMVSERAKTSAGVISQAADAARQGVATVEESIQGMLMIKNKVDVSSQKVKEMERHSGEIGSIVSTIEDIASQTNMLALNAAIEAARAGEYGKGFAVVADEVRKLSERSAQATREISSLILNIQNTISEAVLAMDEGAREVESGTQRASQSEEALALILETIETANRQMLEMADASGQIQQSSDRLSSSISQAAAILKDNLSFTEEMWALASEVTQSMDLIAGVSEENNAAVEEVSASSEEMNAQIEELTAAVQTFSEMAQNLNQVVGRFNFSQEH
ncbi:MAG: methyl-accepting chemotaxis protein, partial [Anaerolineae bacterium]|nr:methyl-accepting chemotaxis protein [Anaerolineae bacterium]